MSRGKVCKGRSEKTYHNKIKKIKKFYHNTFVHSKKNKEINQKNNYKINKKYFCDKYPDEKSF